MKIQQINVYGDSIEECCSSPITGFYRDGFCRTDELDRGLHVVCAKMTKDFLTFSKSKGNDLSTPMPEFGFPGLQDGDRWCLCLARWKQAFDAGKAPQIYLSATHEASLELVPLEILMEYALDIN